MRVPTAVLARVILWSPVAIVGILLAIAAHGALAMPGRSHRGPLPALSPAERELAGELREHVSVLVDRIGERNVAHPSQLAAAATYVETVLGREGRAPAVQSFSADGVTCQNVELELGGRNRAAEIIVIGAHYDSAPGTPGANDNASGVAALLSLARRFAARPTARTLRFVAFVNEEPPYFHGEAMGSHRYAARCRERGEAIVAMLSLESLGYYSDERGSQQYPFPLGWLYPSTGDFVGFVGDTGSRALIRSTIGAFRERTAFPSFGAALPATTAAGYSDHWSFWQHGYPALMVTDTAFLRDPHYHEPTDGSAHLDYDRFARVVRGLEDVIARLAEVNAR